MELLEESAVAKYEYIAEDNATYWYNLDEMKLHYIQNR